MNSVSKRTVTITFLFLLILTIIGYFSYQQIKNLDDVLTIYLIIVLAAFWILFFIAVLFVSHTKANTEHIVDKHKNDPDSILLSKREKTSPNTLITLNRTIEKVDYLKEGYKKAEKKIASLLNAVNEGIIVLDSNRMITSVNQAALNLFQINKNEFSPFFIQVLSTNQELNGLVSAALKHQKKLLDKNITIFLPDDSELYVNLKIETIGDEDIVQGLVLILKDLNVMSELENNLLRSMKFGVITNLASSISHEIKNPLSSMAMHMEILKNRIAKIHSDEDEKVMKSMIALQNEVKRLNRIIQQFLSLARPKKLNLELISVNNIVEDVLTLVYQQAQEQNIKINTNFQPEIDSIYGEPDQLKQVLLNLILNAFAAMKAGGELTIKTKSRDHRFYIEVGDTGAGIPIEIQPKIFELYFTTKKDGGGIGLSISKNIMEAHEGDLHFQTTPGKGTIFIMDFPAKEQTALYTQRTSKLKTE